MSAYTRKQRETKKVVTELMEYSGVDQHVAQAIFEYSKALCEPDTDFIRDHVFMSQLSVNFKIRRHLHPQIIEEIRSFTDDVLERHLIHMKQFAMLICTYISNRKDLKVNFVFNCYDKNKDGLLNYNELYQLLKVTLVDGGMNPLEEDFETDLRDLVETYLGFADLNLSRVIERDEFHTVAKNYPVLIESLGDVLPCRYALSKFKARFENKTVAQIQDEFRNEKEKCLKSPHDHKTLNIYEKLYPVPLNFE